MSLKKALGVWGSFIYFFFVMKTHAFVPGVGQRLDRRYLVGFGSFIFDLGVCVISRGQRQGSLEGSASEQNQDLCLFSFRPYPVGSWCLYYILGRGTYLVLGELWHAPEGSVTEQDHGSTRICLLLSRLHHSFGAVLQISAEVESWLKNHKIKNKFWLFIVTNFVFNSLF